MINNEILSRKILVLSANPKGTNKLRLDEEARDIKEGLRQSRDRDKFIIDSEWAVRTRDIRRAILSFEPQIVHFSGHGSVDGGLAFEDEIGQVKLVQPEALSGLFKLFSKHVQCVLLNACYSEAQADAISRHINFVIGMNKAVGDRAAIEFAVGFYDALGYGFSVDTAYEFGCNAIHIAGIEEYETPVLKCKNTSGALASEISGIYQSWNLQAASIIYPLCSDPPEPISEEKLKLALSGSLAKWEKVVSTFPANPKKFRTELFRQYQFKTFRDAIEFMNQVVSGCEVLNHHPRWENIWRTVSVYLTTWDIDYTISDRDLQLAKYFDKAFSNFPGTDSSD